LNIKLLLNKESFYDILNNTVYRVFGEKISPISRFNIFRYIFTMDIAYCIPSLNVIFTSKFSSVIYPNLLKQYGHSNNIFLSKLKKFYIYCVIRIPLIRFLFSDKVFRVTSGSFFNLYVIQGGSSKIRFVNYYANESLIALKDGYSVDHQFVNEVNFRLSKFTPYSLPILNVNFDNFSYSEPYLSQCNYLYYDQHSFNFLRMNISDIYFSYADSVSSKNVLFSIDFFDKIKCKSNHFSLPDFVTSFINFIPSTLTNTIVPQHFSHGDLQPGNFLLNFNRLYLIDWESCRSRVVYYDLFILNSSARLNPDCFVDSVIDLYFSDSNTFFLPNLNFSLFIPDPLSPKIFSILLAFENLLYYFDESHNALLSDGAQRYIASLERYIALILQDTSSNG